MQLQQGRTGSCPHRTEALAGMGSGARSRYSTSICAPITNVFSSGRGEQRSKCCPTLICSSWNKGLPSSTHVLEKLNRLGCEILGSIERKHETPRPLLVPAGQILNGDPVAEKQQIKDKVISYILSMTVNMKQT